VLLRGIVGVIALTYGLMYLTVCLLGGGDIEGICRLWRYVAVYPLFFTVGYRDLRDYLK